MAGGSFQYSQHRRKPTSSTLTAENVTVLFLVLSCTLKCNLVGCKTKGRGSWLRTSNAQLKARQGASSASVTMWPQSSWWSSTSSPENSWESDWAGAGKALLRLRHTGSRDTQCQLFTHYGNSVEPHSKQITAVGKTDNAWIHRKQETVRGGQQMLAIHIWLVPAIRKSFKRPAG